MQKDAANQLKPALARGEVRCVGATTVAEYRKSLEKDTALARRFQVVRVEEPSPEATLGILRGLKERFETHHGVQIRDAALEAAVTLSGRYITDRYQPDKAIDLVDEACAGLRMQQESRPDELEREQREVLMLKMEESSLLREGESSRLADVRARLASKEKRVAELEEEWNAEKRLLETLKSRKKELAKLRADLEDAQRAGDWTKAGEIKYRRIPALEEEQKERATTTRLLSEAVTEDLIARVVARRTGIAVEAMTATERERLAGLEKALSQEVVGQDEVFLLLFLFLVLCVFIVFFP